MKPTPSISLSSQIFRLSLLFAFLGPVSSFADSKLRGLDRLIAQAEKNPKIPGGSVRMVEDGDTMFDKYFGTLTAEFEQEWDDQTVVTIASISKSITATLTAVLVSEEHLSFSDPVSKYLPVYEDLKLNSTGESVRSPTIAECLSHTAGFPGGTISQLLRNSPVHQGDQAEVARYLAGQGLVTEPGTKYAYSFRGFAAVSRVIEVVTATPFADVLRDKLLEPLGMSETTFAPDVSLSRRIPAYASRAAGYSDEDVAAQIELFRIRKGSFVNAAGSLFSTPDDLQRFLQFHADQGRVEEHQLVPVDIMEKLYQPQPASPAYGLGFNIRRHPIVGHGGASGTSANVDLETGRILIVLTQAGAAPARPLTAGALRLALP